MEFPAHLRELVERARAASRGAGADDRGANAALGNLLVLRSVGSTNALARRVVDEYLAEELAVPAAVVVAGSQTAGRGRHGAFWASAPEAGVYVTLLLPEAGDELLASLPLRVPVALAEVLDRHLPAERPCRIKWPNDLLVAGRKIGGVLIDVVRGDAGRGDTGHGDTGHGDTERGDTERDAGRGGSAGSEAAAETDPPRGAALVGFGINHSQTGDALTGLGGPGGATSLAIETGGAPPPLSALTWELIRAVADELTRPTAAADAVERYRRHSRHRPGDRLGCRLPDGRLEGTFLGFDERGFLRLELTRPAAGRVAGEEVVVSAGEVLMTGDGR